MKMKIFALLAASTLAFTVACGDDDDTNDTSSTSNGGNGSGGNASGGNSSGGGTPDMCVDATNGQPRAMMGDCQGACEILFCCTEQECDPVTQADGDAFIAGCVTTCEGMMSTIAVVNGEDCAGTVGVVSGVSASFADTCENGVSGTGGSGGTGGGNAGGSGGAGGS